MVSAGVDCRCWGLAQNNVPPRNREVRRAEMDKEALEKFRLKNVSGEGACPRVRACAGGACGSPHPADGTSTPLSVVSEQRTGGFHRYEDPGRFPTDQTAESVAYITGVARHVVVRHREWRVPAIVNPL